MMLYNDNKRTVRKYFKTSDLMRKKPWHLHNTKNNEHAIA